MQKSVKLSARKNTRSTAISRRASKIRSGRSYWVEGKLIPARRKGGFPLAQPTLRPAACSVDLEQAGAALAAADAHGHHAPLGLAAVAFLQDVAGEPRAGHAAGMADPNRAAIDVVLCGGDAEPGA